MKNLPRLNNKKTALPLLAVAGAAAIVGGALWLGKRRRASQQLATDKQPENTSANLRHPFRKQHGQSHQGKRGPQA